VFCGRSKRLHAATNYGNHGYNLLKVGCYLWGMTLQQLEYIVALDQHRHFVRASEACFVTQPTLSAMIMKLEEELGVKIFDRSRHPVMPTEVGQRVIQHAREILASTTRLKAMAMDADEDMSGVFRLGIIPTLAPSVLPLILGPLLQRFPRLRLELKEQTTAQLLQALIEGKMDAGLLVTPIEHEGFREWPLFEEPLLVYDGKGLPEGKNSLMSNELDLNRLLLLEEGHCLRAQALTICDLHKSSGSGLFKYAAGSLETLKKLADAQGLLTILPFLSVLQLSEYDKKNTAVITPVEPVRQVSLMSWRSALRERQIGILGEAIQATILPLLADRLHEDKKVIPIGSPHGYRAGFI
jgi:LysR family hydrogen peroxide-inducible transcriptional activator